MKNIALIRHNLFYKILEVKNVDTLKVGNPCSWKLCIKDLNKNSCIISAGVGGDISFEIEMHKLTGAKIILLDPSPTGASTINNTPKDQMEGIVFLPFGLAANSGMRTFSLPKDKYEGSYSYDHGGMETVSFECRSIKDLMKEYKFTHVDLLKMDVEGFEWDILDEILKSQLNISQICVEFHNLHGRYRSGIQRYLTLLRMRFNGYKLISHVGTGDHTFLKKN